MENNNGKTIKIPLVALIFGALVLDDIVCNVCKTICIAKSQNGEKS